MSTFSRFWFVFSLLMLGNSLAIAGTITCKPIDPFEGETDTGTMTGSMSIGDDVPVGTIVYYASFASRYGPGMSCNAQPVISGRIELPFTNELTNISHQVVPGITVKGGSVFETNIKGIGVVFNGHNQKGDTEYDNYNVTLGSPNGTGGTLRAYLYLVKTGPVSPGFIDASSFPIRKRIFQKPTNGIPDGYVVKQDNFPYIGNVFVAKGGVTVINSTCSLDEKNIEIPMGEYEASSFKSIGQPTEWKSSTIRISGCSAFSPGYYKKDVGGLGPDFTMEDKPDVKNRVTITISPTGSVINSNTIALNNTSDSAKGVGIQVGFPDASGNTTPYVFNKVNELSLPDANTGHLTIPIKARYIQTDQVVKPGPAKGAVTFMINYY